VAPTQQAIQPGALYGVPGITQRFEQPETTQADVVNLAVGNNVNWNTVQPFQQTDVVHWWELDAEWLNAYVVKTGKTVTLSPYAPHNLYQNTSIQMQGQYKPIDVTCGTDLAIFQSYRPMRGSAQMAYQPNLGANPAGTFQNAAFPQANICATPSMTKTSTTTPVHLYYELPCSLWFDQYWDLAEDGTIMGPPIASYVSPQYMSGGQRVVKFKTQFAAMNASNADTGPLGSGVTGNVSTTTSTHTGTLRRVGVYAQTDPATMPPVFNWQYQRHSFQYPVAGKTQVNIPITDYGQILSVWVRFFDPTANAPVSVTTGVSKAQLLYGSQLPRYDDSQSATSGTSAKAMQKRFLDQHGFLPPVGTFIWDMAVTDTGGYITNAKAINTLTNANVQAAFTFTSALSATAYAVVGIESLAYVAIQ
jgi:hypothetical protein